MATVTTMNLIAKQTVGSGGASSVTFSSIPATYTDLVVKYSSRSAGSGVYDSVQLSFNGAPSGTSYSYTIGNSGAGGTAAGTAFEALGKTASSSTFITTTAAGGGGGGVCVRVNRSAIALGDGPPLFSLISGRIMFGGITPKVVFSIIFSFLM